MVVAGDQRHAGQAAGGQAAQERQPARAVLGAGHVDAEDLAVPLGVDAGRDQAVHVHRAAALADLLGQRIDPHERVRAAVQRPVPEPFHHLVQLRRHRADLRLGQAHHAQGGGELFHPPGRDTQQVRRGHHRGQRPLGPAAVLQERPGSTTRAAASGWPARPSRPGCPTPAAGSRCGSSPGPASPPRTPRCTRTSTSASIIRWANSRIISRSTSGPADARVSSNCAPRNRHNVTYGHFALLRCHESTSKDREVAASHHGDTPD